MKALASVLIVMAVWLIGGFATGEAADSGLPDPARWNSPTVVRIFELNAGALLSGVYRTVTLLDGAASADLTIVPRAALEGFFYWDGTGTGQASDLTGHVQASIHLAFSIQQQQPQARLYIIRCNDAACSTNTGITNQVLRAVQFFEPHQLKVTYDGNSFVFQLDSDTPVVIAAPHSTRLPPPVGEKLLRTRLHVPALPSASGRILALFEGLQVNGNPYESFDEKLLPRVSLLPGSGTFPSTQTFDIVLLVESPESLAAARVTFDGVELFDLAGLEGNPLLAKGTLGAGGRVYRLPGFSVGGLPSGPHVVAAEVTTQSGKTGRGFAVWNVLPAIE